MLRSCFAAAIIAAAPCVTAVLPAKAAGTAACMRELARTETSLVKTLVHLRGATQMKDDERCSIYQDHVAVVTRAREVFARCMTGADRDTEVSQLDDALSNANALIAQACQAR